MSKSVPNFCPSVQNIYWKSSTTDWYIPWESLIVSWDINWKHWYQSKSFMALMALKKAKPRKKGRELRNGPNLTFYAKQQQREDTKMSCHGLCAAGCISALLLKHSYRVFKKRLFSTFEGENFKTYRVLFVSWLAKKSIGLSVLC